MGSRVAFVRAPRGDATQAPPPIGAYGQLGTSARAAREDHTHEGVHQLVAGDGVAVTPSSGLGDVTVAVRHWRPPVPTASALPASGNETGDARVVLDEASIYVWTGVVWQRVTATGGGGGPGFDEWGAINRLYLGLEQVAAAGRPALTTLSERYDALVDDSGIDWTRSANVELRNGRIVAVPAQWVGFGDDWVRIPPRAGRVRTISVLASMAPGSFEQGLPSVLGAGDFEAGISGVVTPTPRMHNLATEGLPLSGAIADGSFDAGLTGVIAMLPAAARPPTSRKLKVTQRDDGEPARFVPLSPGGFDFGVQSVVDPWGRTGSFEGGVVSTIVARREVVQFATGPMAQVQAADGTFEAGVASVITRPLRRGGTPMAVSERIALPAVPARAYLTARSERVRYEVSRDDGVTWTPIEPDRVVDLSTQPVGVRLRVRAILDDEVRSYVEAWAYGASK
ncbi:hypothetical protein Tmar_0055 [Thermaerobacter marianensis DSM 12885]|uniref:Uncharacterized protein n=1 Tax=Thermaerobacter marianensis (strain ATCC 700841 / DSM 12885 / JCM 10246 / 7p75a) TaxID=644966 RepID=E6SKJ3_THEM7|nr:hypothetical protein [Thermaerobacter marianensis]ADU50180.1 hypothetical protein Tmar_0055 [Thermaerobacter marianensis DSM 12885]